MTSQQDTGARLVQLLLEQMNPDAEVDCAKVADALGLSSMQQLAFLKSVNAEFGTDITPEDLEKASGQGGLRSLLP